MTIFDRNAFLEDDFAAHLAKAKLAMARVARFDAYLNAKPPTRLSHSQDQIAAWDREHPEFAGLRAELWGPQ